jgi:WD40 repeat protein
MGNLAKALNDSEVFGDSSDPEHNLHARFIETALRRGALGLVEVVRQFKMPMDENLLVVVDQFEELFRFQQAAIHDSDSDQAAAFVKLLLEAIDQQELSIYIVLTMRSDYLGDCARFRDLPEALNDSQYLIPRMTRDQLRRAIEGPVAVGGGTISPVLVNRLLNDVGDDPDQLPVLQHALMRTWVHWQGRVGDDEPIDVIDYQAVGGIEKALSQHADEIYENLLTSESKQIAEKLFKCLTEAGSENRGVRRPARINEVSAVARVDDAEVISVVQAFRGPGRTFIMPPIEVELTTETPLDLSHESLMRIWRRLKEWVDEEAASAQMYRRLADRAAGHARGEAALARDQDLVMAMNWQQRCKPNRAWAERYNADFDQVMAFLSDSIELRDSELKERRLRDLQERQREDVEIALRRRAKRFFAVGLGIASMGIIAALWQLRSNQEAQRSNFEPYHRLLLENAPLESLVNGLAAMNAAMDRFDNDPTKAFRLSESLAVALANSQEIRLIEANQGDVLSLAQLNERELVSGGSDGSLRRWRDGQLIGHPIPTEQGEVTSLAMLSNDELVSGGSEGSLRLWRVGKTTIEGDKKIDIGKLEVTTLLRLKNGDLMIGGSDGSLRRMKNHQVIDTIDTKQGGVWSLLELSDGMLISGGSKNLMRWRHGQSVGPKIETDQGQVFGLVTSDCGDFVSGGSSDGGTLTCWRNGKPVGKPVDSKQGGIMKLVQLSNGAFVSAGRDGTLRLWRNGREGLTDAGTSILGRGSRLGTITSLLRLSEGELVTGARDGSIRFWKPVLKASSEPPNSNSKGSVWSLAVHERSQQVFSGAADGTVRKWSMGADGVPFQRFPILKAGDSPIYNIAVLPSGDFLTGDSEGRIRFWRGETPISETPFGEGQEKGVWSMAALSDDSIAIGGGQGRIRFWQGRRFESRPIVMRYKIITFLAKARNGNLLSGDEHGLIQRWSIQPWNRDRPLPVWPEDSRSSMKLKSEKTEVKGQSLFSLVEMSNGVDLFAAGERGNIYWWQRGKGELPYNTLKASQGEIWSLIELQGNLLLSAGHDGTLKFWRNGEPVGESVDTGQDGVLSALYLSKSKVLWLGGKDGTVRVLAPLQVVSSACQELSKHRVLLSPRSASEFAARDTCRRYGQRSR